MVEVASSFTSEPITGYRPKQAEHLITHPPAAGAAAEAAAQAAAEAAAV